MVCCQDTLKSCSLRCCRVCQQTFVSPEVPIWISIVQIVQRIEHGNDRVMIPQHLFWQVIGVLLAIVELDALAQHEEVHQMVQDGFCLVVTTGAALEFGEDAVEVVLKIAGVCHQKLRVLIVGKFTFDYRINHLLDWVAQA